MKSFKVMKIVFGILGIAFLVAAIVVTFTYSKIKQTYQKVDAVVIYSNTDTDYDYTVVEYKYRGISYEGRINYSSFNIREGDTITVMVDPEDARQVKYRGTYVMLIIMFSAMGTSFCLVPIIMNIVLKKRNKLKNFALRNGRRIKAMADQVCENRFVSYNNRHPYYLTCHYKDRFGRHDLKSNNFWDPIDLPEKAVLYVYVIDENKYYVDLTTIRAYDDDVDFDIFQIDDYQVVDK